ncbi:MAG: hypothetical protein Q9205_004355 [Flavoplaca limonia]
MADATRSGYRRSYQEDFKSAVNEIDTAVQRAIPQLYPVYDNVAVLMMSWDNDNIGVRPLEDKLAQIFTHDYNFTVERHIIEAYPQIFGSLESNLMRRLLEFGSRYDAPRTLLIYVYSGHATSGVNYDQCNWFGSDVGTVPQIDWLACRSAADSVRSDVLYLFDCCCAAAAAIDKKDNEYLVAAVMETIASSNIILSFTNRLINILQAQAGTAIAVPQIHAKMIAEMTAANTLMEATPIHVGATTKPAIVLERVVKVSNEVKGLRVADTKGSGKVLVSVKIRGRASIPNAQKFQHWLLSNVPEEVESVKVEAMFQANSCIVYFTLPIEVWGSLDGREGFQFVDYVNSHNLWQPLPEDLGYGSSTGLSLRPRGSENVPPPRAGK